MGVSILSGFSACQNTIAAQLSALNAGYQRGLKPHGVSMKSWKVIIGDGHQKPVEAKTARGAIVAVIAQLGPNAYSAGVYEVRVWPVDDVGAPTAAAKVSTVTLLWVPKLTEDGEVQVEVFESPEADAKACITGRDPQPDAAPGPAPGPEAGER